ncbi:acyl carrier protein [Nocardia sp. NPDC055165]|uniref:acyl carrier protein n=1 Tax=Nocardia sp. NPDC060220 TaxID=3347076 RepID=UPI00365C0FD8
MELTDNHYLSAVVTATEVVLEHRVRPEENFFDIGGDSVSALELVAVLESELRITIPLQDVFHSTSLTDIAARLSARTPGRGSTVK